MDLISKLEKRIGHWAIPHLTLYLLLLQFIGVVLLFGGYSEPIDLILNGVWVRAGDWTRLFSFMMIPRTLEPLWLIFSFYVFHLVGSSLEREWGAFRFNLYILIGYLFTISTAFIAPTEYILNTYLLGSVFLAFATLFPNIEFMIFFILPVKVKWLGWLTAGFYVLELLSGNMGGRLSVLAAFATYFIFFGKTFFQSFKTDIRHKTFVAERVEITAQSIHCCTTCGATEKTDKSMHFRYCSTCGNCFCEKHINDHHH